MAGFASANENQCSLYSGSRAARLWCGRAARGVAFALACALASGGCSYRLDSLWGSSSGKPEQTGSVVAASVTQKPVSSANLPPERDLAYARAAAAEVLARGDKDASQPWENPATGARGTVTPIASSYNQDGFTCQDFLASYVHAGAESWMQGEACRMHRGKWEVKNLKPLQRP